MKLHGRTTGTALCLVMTATFIGLAMPHLGTLSLWADEGLEAHLTTLPFADMWRFNARAQNHPILQPLLMWAWSRLAGHDAFALRLPSVFFGAATIVATYFAGRRVVGETPSRIACVLLAGSSYYLMATQEIRMYPMSRFFYTVGALLMGDCLVRPTRTRVWAAMATILLAWLADVSGLYLLVIAAIFVWVKRRELGARGFPFPTFWGATVPIALLMAAAPTYMAVRSNSFPVPMRAEAVFFIISAFGNGAALGAAQTIGAVFLARLAAIAVPTAAGVLEGARGGDDQRFVVAAAFVPWLAAPLTVAVAHVNVLVDRRLSFTLALFLLLTAMGLARLWRGGGWRRGGAMACVAVLAWSNGLSTANRLTDPAYQLQDWREATAWLAPRLARDDLVVLQTPYCVFVYRYYMGDATTLCLLDGTQVADLAAVAPRHPRVWLVCCQAYQCDPDSLILAWLGTHMRLVQECDFPNLLQPDAAIVVYGFDWAGGAAR